MVDDALVVDLSLMRAVRVDAATTRTAQATTSGIVTHAGLGGLTLGGGIG